MLPHLTLATVPQEESRVLPIQMTTWNTKRVMESVYKAIKTETQFSCLQLWELLFFYHAILKSTITMEILRHPL